MWTKSIQLGDYSFPFRCTLDLGGASKELLGMLDPDLIVLVTDTNVGRLHGSRVTNILESVARVLVLTVQPGESAKTLSVVENLCEAAIAAGTTRRSLVVALGGGAVGNVAGVVAGLLFRGLPLFHIPTTLLAAADSVISLKQAVNSRTSKNNFGLYLAPSGVITDLLSFATLPDREIKSGFGELVKNVLAVAPSTLIEFSANLEGARQLDPSALAKLISLGVECKSHVMRSDPFEKRCAVIFEYGHTVGHAVELAGSRLGDEVRPSHGESVALGMVVAAEISVMLGFADEDLVQSHKSLIGAAGLSWALPPGLEVEEIMRLVKKDNKRGAIPVRAGESPMILLEALGRPASSVDLPLLAVSADVIHQALTKVSERARS